MLRRNVNTLSAAASSSSLLLRGVATTTMTTTSSVFSNHKNSITVSSSSSSYFSLSPLTSAVGLLHSSRRNCSTTTTTTITTERKEEEKNEQQQQQQQQEPADPSKTTTTTPFVFNPFNGRLQARKALVFDQLRSIGIDTASGADSSLSVVDKQKLNAFADHVRTDPRNNLPTIWPRKMRNVLGGLLVQDLDDVSDSVDAYFKRSVLDRMYSRDIRGAIGSVGGGSELDAEQAAAQEASSGLHPGAITLTPEQDRVIDFAMKGYNMYLGGDAGTGKTVTITELVRRMRLNKLRVAVTASTGLAACHLGGTTFHSFAGIGKANDFLQASKKMPIVDVIVIDEVSMISGGLLQRFDQFLRAERCNDDPFGGTQIIICGDFLQLSFILSGDARKDKLARKNVFEIDIFRENFLCLKLVQQVRQAEHERFAQQLRELRVGKVPEDLWETGITNLDADGNNNMCCSSSDEIAEGTIRLLPTNELATAANRQRLAQLPGDEVKFIPCATPPTLSGKWTTTAVLEVPPDNFDVEKFRLALHSHIKQQIVAAANAPSALGNVSSSSNNGGGHSSLENDLLYYLPESSLVAYQTHPDGCVARLMLPNNKEDIAARLTKKWEESLGTMATLASACTASAAAPASPSSPHEQQQQQQQEQGVVPSSHSSSSSSSSSITKASLIDVLPHGDALHTHMIEERLNAAMKMHPVAQPLPLKIGAQVLLRVNLSNKLVNGSVGTVVDFVPASLESLPSYIASNRNMAAALQSYVDHSRSAIGADEAPPVIPVVRFRGVTQDVPIPPWPFAVGGDVGTNYYSMDVVSIPLTLAYAFTAHKVQGLTLLADVRIELQKMWDCDHIVYVAMSRVKSPKQLSITGWKDSLVQSNRGAVKFDSGVKSVGEVVDPTEAAVAVTPLDGAQQQQQQQQDFYQAMWFKWRRGDFFAAGGTIRPRGASATGPNLPGNTDRKFKEIQRAMREGTSSKAFRPSMSDIANSSSGMPKWLQERMASKPAAAEESSSEQQDFLAMTQQLEQQVQEVADAPSATPAAASVPGSSGVIPLAAVVSDKKKSSSKQKRTSSSSSKNKNNNNNNNTADDDVTPPLLFSKSKKGIAAAPVKLELRAEKKTKLSQSGSKSRK